MADVQHSALSGTNLHVPGYVQSSDPGAVGAGILWIDTSGGTGNWVTKIRNVTNTGWEEAGAGGSGVSGYSGVSGFSGVSSPGGSGYTVAITNADLVSGVATITHNLSSRIPMVAVWDSSYQVVFPDAIISIDVNTLAVDLSSFSPISGSWNIKVLS